MEESRQPLVVKIGGSTLGSHDTALADIAALCEAGERLVVVHGGGNAATDWLQRWGIPSEFVEGLRVTGPDAIDVVTAVFAGLVNKQLVASLRALGTPAFGLSGVDGGLLETRQLDDRLGFVGEITSVNLAALEGLAGAGSVPILAPIGYWREQPERLMNLNADTVAGEVAAALRARELIFLTDVAHVRNAEGAAIEELAPNDVDALIEQGVVSGGMIPKLRASARAARDSVRCLIVDGREENALSLAHRGKAAGTVVHGKL